MWILRACYSRFIALATSFEEEGRRNLLQASRRLYCPDILFADDENRKIDTSQEHSGNQGNER